MKALVIAVRGLQAGYVGCYGNAWIATPTLDALAAEGVIFDQHFADRADAAGARRTWRDGRHHLPDPSQPEPSGEERADLITQLRLRGIYTCLIVDDSRPAESVFDAGWDETVRAGSFDAALDAASAALDRVAGRDALLLWLDVALLIPPWDTPEESLAAYFQGEPATEEEEEPEEEEATIDPLTPLNDPPTGPVDPTDDELFERLQLSYAAAVTRLDEGVGRLLERLDAVDANGETLVVLTADHGLALGEHGYVGSASPHAHEETVHLPLILCLPGADEAGRRVAALTQATDLAATLADVFEVELPAAHGRTLLPLVYSEAEEMRPYACSGVEGGGVVEWSLRTPEWAFLLPVQPPGPPRLYVKPDDRWEVNNVLQHHMELAEGLERTLRGFVAATRREGPLEAPGLPDVHESGEQPAGPEPE